MKRIVIVPGHSFHDPGAVNDRLGLREYDCVLEMALQLFQEDKWRDIDVVLKGRNTYPTLPQEINSLKPDYIIELHLNADHGKSQGTEVLYCSASSRGKEMAEIIEHKLVDAIGYSDRGIKPVEKGHRGAKILWHTDAPCVIVESCFIDSIDSKDDLKINETVIALEDSIREIVDRRI